MTMEEYQEKRKAKNKADRRLYIKKFVYYIKFIPLVIIAYFMLWIILAMIS